MHVSILGAGKVGGTLARALAERGHEVIVGSREPAEAVANLHGTRVERASLREAASASPLVIHATPGHTAVETLSALREPLRDKILLDVANATERSEDGLRFSLCFPNGSLAERVQQELPETRVVKALNTMLFSVMASPESLSSPPNVYMSSDHENAKRQVATLLGSLGWRDEWIVDLGGLVSARATEAMILMVPHMLQTFGRRPFALGVVR